MTIWCMYIKTISRSIYNGSKKKIYTIPLFKLKKNRYYLNLFNFRKLSTVFLDTFLETFNEDKFNFTTTTTDFALYSHKNNYPRGYYIMIFSAFITQQRDVIMNKKIYEILGHF